MNRIVDWFARNHVAANLLMGLIVIGGTVALFTTPMKSFPDVEIRTVTVTVEYLGAAPEEVEDAVCIRIEEQVEGINGIERMRSIAAEGACTVTLEIFDDADLSVVLDEIKNRVDAIDTFPEETEEPIITKVDMLRSVMDLALTGTDEEKVLKELAQTIRDEIIALPGITQAQLANARPYEISIEVSEGSLRRHGLSFAEVAQAVRRSSLDLPGGSIKTAAGEILLRTKGQAYVGEEFEKLVVLTRPDGSRVLLADVATVVDGFEDTDQALRFNGDPAALIRVYRVGEQNLLEMVATLKAYLEELGPRLPAGVRIAVLNDGSEMLRDRLDTLVQSGRLGLLLVLLLLAFTLQSRLAFWVSMSIPISMLGGLWALSLLGFAIDSILMFGFIMVLGILVDDAIVVGENVYRHQQQNEEPLAAAIAGTREVTVPVIFGVLTTMVAFVPLLLSAGLFGQISAVIASAVILCLLFSLIECFMILPSHLGGGNRVGNEGQKPNDVLIALVPIALLAISAVTPGLRSFLVALALLALLVIAARRSGHLAVFSARATQLQEAVSDWVEEFTRRRYRGWVEAALEWRYVSASAALAVLLCAVAVLASGHVRFTYFPPLEGDSVTAKLTMPQGIPAHVTVEAVAQIERAAAELQAEIDAEYSRPGESVVRDMVAASGGFPITESRSSTFSAGRAAASGSHLGEVTLQLVPSQQRDITTREVADRWRDRVGPIPGAVELGFYSSLFSVGDAIDIRLQGRNIEHLREAAARIRGELAKFPGVFDISDSFRAGKQELKLEILPAGESLGLTLNDLARQVRRAFYGEEAQRIQRGRDELRVMVRYPREERRSLAALERMRIRTADGDETPFSAIARAELGQGFSTIRRTDRQRVVNVTADLDRTVITPNEVLDSVVNEFLPQLMLDYPGMSYGLEGEQEESAESGGSTVRLFGIALFAIYALLAVPLRSYTQPLLIMSIIPFTLVGALIGHVVLGIHLSFMSMQGLVAAAGVVVNDSLILIHYINRQTAAGASLQEAVRAASVSRFRPIMLTSLTTFVGLVPLMLNTSVQAQFIVPMAASLSFGVFFATSVTLIVLPCGYLILEDLRELIRDRRGLAAQGQSTAG